MQFFCRIIFVPDYRTGIIEHAVNNRRGLRLKPPHPPAKIASRMQFFWSDYFCAGLSNRDYSRSSHKRPFDN